MDTLTRFAAFSGVLITVGYACAMAVVHDSNLRVEKIRMLDASHSPRSRAVKTRKPTGPLSYHLIVEFHVTCRKKFGTPDLRGAEALLLQELRRRMKGVRLRRSGENLEDVAGRVTLSVYRWEEYCYTDQAGRPDLDRRLPVRIEADVLVDSFDGHTNWEGNNQLTARSSQPPKLVPAESFKPLRNHHLRMMARRLFAGLPGGAFEYRR